MSAVSPARIDELRAALEHKSRVPASKPQWQPPGLEEFETCKQVLAFDASLSNVGWVSLRVLADPLRVDVSAKGTIRSVTDQRGFLETWAKAVKVTAALKELAYYFALADYVPVESPSVGGGYRTESSLIAGLKVWEEAPADKRFAVSAQHVARVLCGDARIPADRKKQAIRGAVARYIPGSESRSWNEHQRDAAAVGLTHLWDRRNR